MLGFENAPITRVIAFASFLLTYLLGGRSADYSLDFDRVLRGEVWRLFSHTLIFPYVTQSLFAAVLFYNFSIFERQMGTRKFAAFLVFCYLYCLLATCAVEVVGGMLDLHVSPASGPYFIIYALVAFYYKYIPKLQAQQTLLLGSLPLSSKSWIYLLLAQLACSDGVNSLLAAAVGSMAGYVYDQEGWGLQRFRLPAVVEAPFIALNRAISFLAPAPTPAAPRPAPRAAGSAARENAEGVVVGGARNSNNASLRNRAGGRGAGDGGWELPPPDEESITVLMGMGFDRQDVIQALRTCGNNVDAAANMLLR